MLRPLTAENATISEKVPQVSLLVSAFLRDSRERVPRNFLRRGFAPYGKGRSPFDNSKDVNFSSADGFRGGRGTAFKIGGRLGSLDSRTTKGEGLKSCAASRTMRSAVGHFLRGKGAAKGERRENTKKETNERKR